MKELYDRAARLVACLKEKQWTISTVESLTGGMAAQAITSVPGASQVLGFGFVTYSPQAKMKLVGVPARLIEAYTVVSRPVAAAMAQGALAVSGAQLAVSFTGLAGPDGGTPECPVGTVYIGVAQGRTTWVERESFGNPGREEVRQKAVSRGLELALLLAQGDPAPAGVWTQEREEGKGRD